IEVPARTANGIQRGTVIMPFTYHEAAANLLTSEALDPFGKIPEFKYCAVSLVPKATNQRRFATG
ncbi:MAG: molybdopterin dinucleotide binding domain-containing protein, partial [Chromatiales bacterium]